MYFRGGNNQKNTFLHTIFLTQISTHINCVKKKSYNFYESPSQNFDRGDWFLPHKSLVGIS